VTAAVGADAVHVTEQPARHRGFFQRWYRSPTFVAGLVILAAILAMALFAPLITSYDPIVQHPADALQDPSGQHWLGTDELGRDVWTRLLYGARVDLKVSGLAVLFPFIIGTALGCITGYFGRWLDAIVIRIADVMVAFPFYVLIIALVFVLGSGERSIYIAITMITWVGYTRIVRGETIVAKQQEYILAARSTGVPTRRVISRHLLPNVITQAVVFATSDVVLDILGIVTLGYLGLGIQLPTPDWGSMISDGQDFLTTKWWLATAPGIAVVVTAVGFSLLGDGLADLLRPE
jgi:peptide/nickel transport system permease protein